MPIANGPCIMNFGKADILVDAVLYPKQLSETNEKIPTMIFINAKRKHKKIGRVPKRKRETICVEDIKVVMSFSCLESLDLIIDRLLALRFFFPDSEILKKEV
jgi:hypothetical protein